MSDYFPKSKSVKGNIKFDLDLSNYTPKADLQNATGVNTSNFVKKSWFSQLKSEIAELGIGKLETTPTGLSKLSDIVKNEIVKKTVYDKLVKKN